LLRRLQKAADFSIDLDSFRNEVQELLAKCQELQQEEEKQRQRMADAYSSLAAIQSQIDITNRSLAELREDRSFAEGAEGETIRCPTCHAEYDNGFMERFSIAVDEDRCVELLSELEEERKRAREDYENAKNATGHARQLAEEVSALLTQKRQELQFQDVVRSESRREMRRVVQAKIRDLSEQIGELEVARDAARKEMKQYESKERSKRILGYYRSELDRLMQRLEVRNVPDDSTRRVDAKIRETGSDLPRAILAFFLASVRTIAEHSTCAMCPLVIDSPRQQDQDDASWEQIRAALQDERPENTQLILAMADDGGTDFGGNVIELTDPDTVLQKSEYDDVKEEIMPLLNASFESSEE
jgi:vacuolar-type H+-ATPase subunit I/STV1